MIDVLIFFVVWSVVAIAVSPLLSRAFFRDSPEPVTPQPVRGEETHPVVAADRSATGLSMTGSGVRPQPLVHQELTDD